jgi:hypothetical protein
MAQLSTNKTRHRLVAVAVFTAVTLGGGALALAEDASPTVEQIQIAERSFSQGRDAFRNGSFTEAAEHFERADANAPNDRVLELAISSREKADHVDRAVTLAQLGIDRYPESDRMAQLAAPLLERAKAELISVTIECDEPCTLLDGTRIVHGAASTRRIVYLSPGKHSIRANWSHERSASEVVTGEAGAQLQVAFAAPEIPEEPEAPAPALVTVAPEDGGAREPPSGIDPVFFWIGAGVTAAVGGVAIWSGVDTLNNPGKEAVQRECVGLGTDCPEYQDGKNKEFRTNVLLAATGAAGITTVVLGLLTNWSGSSSAKSGAKATTAEITPWVGVGDGAVLGANGRF